uniref:Collagen, type XIV, alpha 1b n=1 Tax=Fundulus heteroclitus TaxID=8078 RepID=A0A3Q2QNS9_FUNHE
MDVFVSPLFLKFFSVSGPGCIRRGSRPGCAPTRTACQKKVFSTRFKEISLLCLFHPECSLGMDVQADVVLLVDGSYSIGVKNFEKVKAFLEVLVKTFDVGADKVQIGLVQYSRDAFTEFYLNTHQDVQAVVEAVRSFPYRGGSTNTGKAMAYVREKIFKTNRGARANVPRVTILITDGKSSDAFKDSAARLRNADVEIFAVGVKEAVRSELEAIANAPAETHVYTVEDFDAFQRISKELTQAICLRIEQELRSIYQRREFLLSADHSVLHPFSLSESCHHASPAARSLTVSEETERTMKVSWTASPGDVVSYRLRYVPSDGGKEVVQKIPGGSTSTVLKRLQPLTSYSIAVVTWIFVSNEHQDLLHLSFCPGQPVPAAGTGDRQGTGGNVDTAFHSLPTGRTQMWSKG